MSTASSTFTPMVSDVSVVFTSDCTPAGQVSFGGLSDEETELTISKDGYQTSVQNVNINSTWQEVQVNLSP